MTSGDPPPTIEPVPKWGFQLISSRAKFKGRREIAIRSRVVSTIALAGLAVALAPAAFAEATNRFVAPGGGEEWPCTDPQRPCSFQFAARHASLASDDHIVMAGGTHVVEPGSMMLNPFRVVVRAASVNSRPRILLTEGVSALWPGEGGKLQDITIDSSSRPSGTTVVLSGPGTTLERVIVLANGDDLVVGVGLSLGATIRNSIVRATGTGSRAINVGLGGGHVRNATLVTDGDAIRINACDMVPPTTVAVTVFNTAIVAGGADIRLVSASCPGRTGNLTIGNSAFSASNSIIVPGEITFTDLPGNINRTADNVLLGAGPLAGWYLQRPGSQTIDAGLPAGHVSLGGIGPGDTDLLGNPRAFGPAPDIGAVEFEKRKPKLTTTVKRTGSKRVRVRVRCDERCRVRIAGGVKALKWKALGKNQALVKRLKVKKPRKRTVTVRFVATDLHGNKTIKRVKARLKGKK